MPISLSEEPFDGRDIECPDLMLAVRRFILKAAKGYIYLITKAPTSVNNIKQLCAGLGHQLIKLEEQNDEFHFVIEIK